MLDTNLIILIYWFFCYTALLGLLIVSAIRTLVSEINEKYHFLMILSFALLMIGTTITIIINSQNSFFNLILQIIANSGICLGIYSVPAFAIKTSRYSYKYDKYLNILKLISFCFFLLLIIVISIKKFIFIFYTIYILYFITIALTSTFGIYSLNKDLNNKKSFWNDYLSKIGLLSICFVPLFIIIDLFAGFGIHPILNLSNQGFRTFPLFFTLWSFIYFYEIYKFNANKILNQIKRNAEQKSLTDFSLTAREEEVLELLLSGLSYKQIASKLSISLATVKTHVCRIYEKTETNSKIELFNKLLS